MEANEQVHYFHWADYLVFVSSLVISLAIGVYYAFSGGKQKTVQEYLLGDRSMGVLPIAMSLLASFLSAIGMISVPAEIYMYGFGGTYGIFAKMLALPVAGLLYLPTFYHLGLTSVYEYIEKRFDSRIRKVGSILFIAETGIYIGFVLYAPSLALSQVTGINLWGSVIAITVLGAVYTSIGGIKAVMWTDVFQITVMFVAMTVVVIKGCLEFGGLSEIMNKGVEGDRVYWISMSPDPRLRYTFWNVMIGHFTMWITVYGTNQSQVQRYLSSPSKRRAQLSLFWNFVGGCVFSFLMLVSGLLVYAKYWNCDPLTANLIRAHDQVFPLFVMETLNTLPGLPGLFVAGVFCGSLSTMSSAWNAMAAITLEDFVRAFKRWENISSEKAAKISKLLAAFYAFFCLMIVVAISQSDGNIIQGSSYNIRVFSGTVFGLFTFGLFFPWANKWGAYGGVFIGLVLSTWVSVASQVNKQFSPRSSYSTDACTSMYNISLTTTPLPQTVTTMHDVLVSSVNDTPQIYDVILYR